MVRRSNLTALANKTVFFKRSLKSENKGDLAEQEAKNFLIKQGLKFVDQNYSCKLGEIDLIMEDKETLVFVEVRFRASNAFGGAAASVSQSKQNKIIKTATHYLVAHNLYEKRSTRFDVIACSNNDTQWIQGAF